MCLKIFAMGFFKSRTAYLRDPWNVLDFFIVVTGIISDFTSFQNIEGLRALRVLRPLRTVSKIKSLRNMVLSLFMSIRMLKDSLIIMTFFLSVFSIISLQILSGTTSQQCMYSQNGIFRYSETSILNQCAIDSDCESTQYCVVSLQNPFNNFLNFDTFGWSIIQIITQEGWTDIVYAMQLTSNRFLWLYAFLIVFIGSYFIINLLLAVVAINFLQTSHLVNCLIQDKFEEQNIELFNYNLSMELKIIQKRLFKNMQNRKLSTQLTNKEIYNILNKTIKNGLISLGKSLNSKFGKNNEKSGKVMAANIIKLDSDFSQRMTLNNDNLNKLNNQKYEGDIQSAVYKAKSRFVQRKIMEEQSNNDEPKKNETLNDFNVQTTVQKNRENQSNLDMQSNIEQNSHYVNLDINDQFFKKLQQKNKEICDINFSESSQDNSQIELQSFPKITEQKLEPQTQNIKNIFIQEKLKQIRKHELIKNLVYTFRRQEDEESDYFQYDSGLERQKALEEQNRKEEQKQLVDENEDQMEDDHQMEIRQNYLSYLLPLQNQLKLHLNKIDYFQNSHQYVLQHQLLSQQNIKKLKEDKIYAQKYFRNSYVLDESKIIVVNQKMTKKQKLNKKLKNLFEKKSFIKSRQNSIYYNYINKQLLKDYSGQCFQFSIKFPFKQSDYQKLDEDFDYFYSQYSKIHTLDIKLRKSNLTISKKRHSNFNETQQQQIFKQQNINGIFIIRNNLSTYKRLIQRIRKSSRGKRPQPEKSKQILQTIQGNVYKK